MRIVDVLERSIAISRYADGDAGAAGGLTTSIVAVVTSAAAGRGPLVGYGFASIGRYAQGGLIRERFAPRLLAAPAEALADDAGHGIDPLRAWEAMMAGEKPGGHGERPVAVGALDMAIWDAAAKAADLPLWRYAADRLGTKPPDGAVPVYAGGGYYYAQADRDRLADEVRRHLDAGFERVKIKIGGRPLAEDLARIDAAAEVLGGADRLAVDAMNGYGADAACDAADALAPHGLWWFEDICDPLDFELQARVAARYTHPIAAGEALFSRQDVRNLALYGGLRADRDILLMDPAHCYGLTCYARMVDDLDGLGWGRGRLWPHGGHLFTLHVAKALGLAGAECNPHNFQPFGGFGPDVEIAGGHAAPPDAPGIGFETKPELEALFADLGRG